MYTVYKVRAYPTKSQQVLISKHLGSCRFLHNKLLGIKIDAYNNEGHTFSRYDLSGMIPAIKEEFHWLKEVSANTLQCVCKNIETAYKNFFSHGNRYPRFRKRSSRESFQVPQAFNIDCDNFTIQLPKFDKPLRVVFTRPIIGTVKSLSVTRYSTGKVFINILVDTGLSAPEKKPIAAETTVGIDLGLIDKMVLSDGTRVAGVKADPKFDAKLAYHQRIFAKNGYQGKRRKKKIALLYEKKRFQSEDRLHKESYQIVQNYDTICMENLSVANLKRNKHLAKAFTRQSLGRLQQLIEYKCEKYGKNYVEVGMFYASSKTCSACGCKNKKLTLSVRKWSCSNCGATHDRDLNAAINIKNEGLSLLSPSSSGGYRVKNQKELSRTGGVITGSIGREALITEGSMVSSIFTSQANQSAMFLQAYQRKGIGTDNRKATPSDTPN